MCPPPYIPIYVSLQVACGEHHTAALSSVPYAALNAEVAEWLAMEKDEHVEKKKHVGTLSHASALFSRTNCTRLSCSHTSPKTRQFTANQET